MNIRATKISAFLSGLSLGLAASIMNLAKREGFISFNTDSSNVFPFFVLYFLLTGVLYVIGIEAIKAKQLHRESGVLFLPTIKEARQVYYSVWLRMFIWFIGGGVGMLCVVIL